MVVKDYPKVFPESTQYKAAPSELSAGPLDPSFNRHNNLCSDMGSFLLNQTEVGPL